MNLKEAKALAETCDKVIRSAAESMAKSSLRIGWYGRIMRENNLFRELGFEDEIEYYQSCGIGRSTWFRAVEIAEAFKDVPKDTVLSMKIENARMLAKIPENIRLGEDLVKAATSDLCRDFEIKLKSLCPATPLGVAKIRRIALIVEMSDRDRREVNAAIEQWMEENKISDRGMALKSMILSVISRPAKAA